MLKAVYDTNVLISAFIAEGSCREIFRAVLQGKIALITSGNLLAEFKDVLSREKFGLKEQQVNKMTSILKRASELITPRQTLNVIKEDPKDNAVLECAVEGEARYIVSGDKHLCDLKKYKHITILTPAEFAKILRDL